MILHMDKKTLIEMIGGAERGKVNKTCEVLELTRQGFRYWPDPLTEEFADRAVGLMLRKKIVHPDNLPAPYNVRDS